MSRAWGLERWTSEGRASVPGGRHLPPGTSGPAPGLTGADRDGAHAGVGMVVRRPRAVIVVVACGALVASLTQTLVVPALPMLPALLDASPGATSWLVTVTVVAAAAAHPILGRLADQFGLRRVLVCTMAAFVLGSLACALTRDLGVLLAGRAVQGGATASVPVGISLLSALLPPRRRAVGVALVSVMLGLGGAVGLSLSGLIIAVCGVPGLFVVPAVAGVLVVAGLLVLVPEPPRGDGGSRVDLVGGLLLVGLLTLLLLPLSRGGAWGWTSTATLGSAAAGGVLAVLFAVVQLRRRSPMIDLRLAAARPALLTNLACLLVGVALFVNFLGTTAVLQAPVDSGYGFGLDIVVAGAAMLPGGVLMAVVAALSARIVLRFGGRATLLFGVALVTAGFLPRLLVHGQAWQVIGSAALVSAGTAAVFAAVPALILDTTPRSRTAAANGLNALARSVGLALASALFGALSAFGGAGYVVFFDVGGACAVLALGAAILLPRTADRTAACAPR